MVTERGGELRCLTEVVLLVVGRLVNNTCKHMEQHNKVFTMRQLQPCVTHRSSNYKRLCLKAMLLYVGFVKQWPLWLKVTDMLNANLM